MTDVQPTPPLDPRLAPSAPVSAPELASQLAARMCHDFISPASAITSGLDLMDDPSAVDMRDEALSLIGTSAAKLMGLLSFSRVAFGASASAESFDTRDLEKLTRGIYDHVRPDLDWAIAPTTVNKACARALLNMAQIATSALPTGGVARLTASHQGDMIVSRVEARSARARLRPEIVVGLNGQRLESGLGGQWVQAYYLNVLVHAAGGRLEHQAVDGLVTMTAYTPA
jgi:histidine phosphotransferase ChpT